MKRHVIILFLFVFIFGCNNATEKSLWNQIKELGQEKTDLKMRVEELEKENEQLGDQVQTLSTLDKDIRLEAVSTLETIEIGKRTDILDKDGDDNRESLVVYIQPIDDSQDTVKTPGRVEVELWNLDAKSNNAKLGEWEVGPEELKELWVSTFMTYYYRLSFDTSNLLTGDEKELTVKVTFTDYLSGKVFRQQTVITP